MVHSGRHAGYRRPGNRTDSRLRGEIVERLVAHAGGMLLALRSKAFIREGDWGVLVATNA